MEIRAAISLSDAATAADALQAVAEAARVATGADLAVVRDAEGGALTVRAAAGPAYLVAELEGSSLPGVPPERDLDDLDELSAGARAVARRAGADAVLILPVRVGASVGATLEVMRAGPDFDV